MGDVVPIRAPRCRCGWRLPLNVQVELIGRVFTMQGDPDPQALVSLQCPECLGRIQLGDRKAPG